MYALQAMLSMIGIESQAINPEVDAFKESQWFLAELDRKLANDRELNIYFIGPTPSAVAHLKIHSENLAR